MRFATSFILLASIVVMSGCDKAVNPLTPSPLPNVTASAASSNHVAESTISDARDDVRNSVALPISNEQTEDTADHETSTSLRAGDSAWNYLNELMKFVRNNDRWGISRWIAKMLARRFFDAAIAPVVRYAFESTGHICWDKPWYVFMPASTWYAATCARPVW